MSEYFKILQTLQKDLKEILKKRKKKPLKENQQKIYDFINGKNKFVEFIIDDKKIILRVGDEKKGFKHILLRHYCQNCKGKLNAMDILNMDLILKRGIKLNSVGVTNNNLIVYMYKNFKIVLKPEKENSFVVTMYSVV